jgi:RHS repeat-associated protein
MWVKVRIIPGLNPNYTGHEHDNILGIYYAKERFYDPELSRWLSKDEHWNPSNILYGEKPLFLGKAKFPDIHFIQQSTNLYSYCVNNPLKYTDSLGRFLYCDCVPIAVQNAVFSGFTWLLHDTDYNRMWILTYVMQDEFAQRILAHWFYGNGNDLIIKNNAHWTLFIYNNNNVTKEIQKKVEEAIDHGESRFRIPNISIPLSAHGGGRQWAQAIRSHVSAVRLAASSSK